MKYEVGDRVKIRSWESMAKEFGTDSRGNIRTPYDTFVVGMWKYCGKVVTISYVHENHYSVKDCGWNFTDDMIEKIENEAYNISLFKRDNKVIAFDKNSGKRGVAICSPEDKFDFNTGAEIAFARLIGKKEPPKKPAPKYFSGEIVCIKNAGGFTVGKVYKVKNGTFYNDNGSLHGLPCPYTSLKDINDNHLSEFAKLVR